MASVQGPLSWGPGGPDSISGTSLPPKPQGADRIASVGSPSTSQYIAQARQAILELLESERAAVWAEIEAKIADAPWESLPRSIAPHLLTIARQQLVGREVEEVTVTTRGNRRVGVLVLAGRATERATQDAAARKRLLHGRFLSWGVATNKRPNLLGKGGETAFHSSLLSLAPDGFLPLRKAGGEIADLFGEPVPGGPLDSAARIVLLGDGTEATAPVVTLLVEVKNVRHWLYPDDWESFQLLDKAARLQSRFPEHRFIPLLVCRRAHYWAFKMASDLGFFIANTGSQFLQPHERLDSAHVEEVRAELSYDMVIARGPHDALKKRLAGPVKENAPRFAERFSETAQVAAAFFGPLRDATLDRAARGRIMRRMYEAVLELPDRRGGWRAELPVKNEDDEPDGEQGWDEPGDDGDSI